MNLKLDSFTEEYAKQVCDWKYENEYSIYNYPEWNVVVSQNWGISIETKRQNEFYAVTNEVGDLCGFIRLVDNKEYVLVGIGLKASLCGKGLGNNVMELLKHECKLRYGSKKIVLEVRSFNERAIKCYKKAGFVIVGTYRKDTPMGNDEFIKMEFS